MIAIKVHEKNRFTVGDLLQIVKTIAEDQEILFLLEKLKEKYKKSNDGHVSVLKEIQSDFSTTHPEKRTQFFSAMKAFLLDEDPGYKRIMREEIVVRHQPYRVIEYIMESLKKLFEKSPLLEEKESYYSEVMYFDSEHMQGLDMLSISLGIKRLFMELEPLQKNWFTFVCEHDPEKLTVTISLKK